MCSIWCKVAKFGRFWTGLANKGSLLTVLNFLGTLLSLKSLVYWGSGEGCSRLVFGGKKLVKPAANFRFLWKFSAMKGTTAGSLKSTEIAHGNTNGFLGEKIKRRAGTDEATKPRVWRQNYLAAFRAATVASASFIQFMAWRCWDAQSEKWLRRRNFFRPLTFWRNLELGDAGTNLEGGRVHRLEGGREEGGKRAYGSEIWREGERGCESACEGVRVWVRRCARDQVFEREIGFCWRRKFFEAVFFSSVVNFEAL